MLWKLCKGICGRRKTLVFLPDVFIGLVSFAAGDDILRVKETADQMPFDPKKLPVKKIGAFPDGLDYATVNRGF